MRTRILLSTILIALLPLTTWAQYEFFDYPGATQTWVTGMNDNGDFVGYFDDGSGDMKGFYVVGSDTGVLDYPTAIETWGYGINNSRQIVGKYNATITTSETEGFMYDYGTTQYTDLTTAAIGSVDHTQVTDINDNDCWAGNFRVSTTAKLMYKCPSNSLYQEFVNISKPTYGQAISNSGYVGGFYVDGANIHGFISTGPGLFATIDNPNSIKTRIYGMNDDLIVVGDYANSRGFVYDGYLQSLGNGAYEDIEIEGAVTVHPQDINNENHICGYYTDGNGLAHGFFIRDYDLVFRSNTDGWNFGNSGANLWPYEEYNTMDYRVDQYLKSEYDITTFFPPWSTEIPTDVPPITTFPSWPLFVETFTEGQIYENVNGVPQMKPAAYDKWLRIKTDNWGGSCAGFSATSLMAFDSTSLFLQAYPSVPSPNIHSLPANVATRKAINKGQTTLFAVAHDDHTFDAFTSKTAAVTLSEIKAMMVDEDNDDMTLSLQKMSPGRSGAHNVVPFKVERVDNGLPGWEDIYVYDSNYPNDTLRKIRVNKNAANGGEWYYEATTNQSGQPEEWGGAGEFQGIYLTLPISSYAGYQALELFLLPNGQAASRFNGHINAYFSSQADEMLNVGGSMMGYVNDNLTLDAGAGVPLLYNSGALSAPYGYMVNDQSSFTATINNIDTTNVSMAVYGNGFVMGYNRDDATQSQADNVGFDGGLTFTNPDATTKSVDLFTYIEESGTSYHFWLNDIPSEQNAQLHIEPVNGNELIVTNTGDATHYQLTVSILSPSDASVYVIDSVPFATDATHHIVPNWADLSNDGLYITVDTTTVGVDDTLFLSNQALPKLATSEGLINEPPVAGTDTIAVINSGAGTLNWQVVESPSWVTITAGNTGVDDELIIFDYSDNLGAQRSGWVVINSNDVNSPDSILIVQDFLVGVSQFQNQEEVAVYPNPANDMVNLSFKEDLGVVDIKLTDLSGRLVKQVTYQNTQDKTVTLDVSGLTKGIYLLDIISTETRITEKLIIK